MQPRLEALRRVKSLCVAVEEMHSMELRREAAALHETQQAIAAEQQTMRLSKRDGCESSLTGDRIGRTLANIRYQYAAWRRENLEEIRGERERLNELARARYLASRQKKEQVESVFEDAIALIEIEDARRVQGVSDDRFLARRQWLDAREKRRKSGK